MQKITVITGPEESGKSFLANSISLAYQKPKIFCGWKLKLDNPFLFSVVDFDTDLIVIDDVNQEIFYKLIFMCFGYIFIEKQGEECKKIKSPKVIITISNLDIKNIPASISRRIEIIECEKTGNIFNFKKF